MEQIDKQQRQQQFDENSIRVMGEEFLKENVSPKAKLLFITAVGSTLYNLKNENKSDFDFVMIYLLPCEQFLSMPSFSIDEPKLSYIDINSIGSTKTRVLNLADKGICTVTKDGNDISCFEIGKYLELCLHGNPFVFQTLFVPDFFPFKYQSKEWACLKELNLYFLNKKVISSHCAFAKRQLQQGEGKIKRGYQKNYYHSLRLCYETERLIQGKAPRIWFENNSTERDQLMQVRNHLPSEEKRSEYHQFIMTKLSSIEKSKPWVHLKDLHEIKINSNDDDNEEQLFVYHLNKWLIQLRLQEFTERMSSTHNDN